MKLQGKVALVTGGGSGIGAAVARRLVADGAKVCIAGRRGPYLDKVAERLPPDRVVTCIGDVTRSDDVERMVTAACAFSGGLDVLVNNAGVSLAGGVTDLDPAQWRRSLDVNLTGPFLLMKAVIPHMTKRGGGSIINIASIGGLRCLPGRPAYCASKAGLIMLTRQAALDYGAYNIRCNAVCPGAVRTALLEAELAPPAAAIGTDVDGMLAAGLRDVPMRRPAAPDEIAGVCSFLAGDDSSYMTGAVLVLDGGATVVDVFGAALQRAAGP